MEVTFISGLVLTVLIFLFGMFLSYRDAVRTNKPSGFLAKLYGYLSFVGWDPVPDEKMKGFVFRQNLLVRIISALAFTIFMKIAWSIIIGLLIGGAYTKSGWIFSNWGIVHSIAALVSMYLFDYWPSVREKAMESAQQITDFGKDKISGNGKN